MAEKVKRRRGRPTNPESTARANNLTLRVRPEIKEALERRAAERGRSLSAEVELRLGQSLESGSLLDDALDLAFGHQGAGFFLLLARVLHDTGNHAGFLKTHTLAGASEWLDVPYAFDQAKQAVDAIFEALYPEGDREPPRGGKIPDGLDLDEFNKHVGASYAAGALEVIAGRALPGLAEAYNPLADKVRVRLGPAAVERIKQWVMEVEEHHG